MASASRKFNRSKNSIYEWIRHDVYGKEVYKSPERIQKEKEYRFDIGKYKLDKLQKHFNSEENLNKFVKYSETKVRFAVINELIKLEENSEIGLCKKFNVSKSGYRSWIARGSQSTINEIAS